MTNTPEEKPTGLKKWLPIAAIASIAIAAGVFAGSRHGNNDTNAQNAALEKLQENLNSATVFPDDFKSIPTFSLLHGEDQPFTEKQLSDKWTVLFFGFTNCPDICPNTLNEMTGVVSELSASGMDAPQIVFITVDPVRDTVEKMTEYVNYFNTEFIGVSGDLTDITELTSKLGIVVRYIADPDGGDNYNVDHTASMLVIDPKLRVRAKLNAPHKIDTIVADLNSLMTHYN